MSRAVALLPLLALLGAAPSHGHPMTLGKPGEAATIRGRVAKIIAAHMMIGVKGKRPTYFDLEGGGQIVVYAVGELPADTLLELKGTVLEARGPPKKPGQRPSKVDDTYSEEQLDVESFRAIAR